MSSNTVISHPSWCDPRMCRIYPERNAIHQSAPVEFGSTRDDTVISVALEQIDEIGDFTATGTPWVVLAIRNTACGCDCGRLITADTALSPTDGRFLMASLGGTVDRLEELLAVTR